MELKRASLLFKLTLVEAFKSKLNVDSLYTSVFKDDGTMFGIISTS
jgi:hypothetical protein